MKLPNLLISSCTGAVITLMLVALPVGAAAQKAAADKTENYPLRIMVMSVSSLVGLRPPSHGPNFNGQDPCVLRRECFYGEGRGDLIEGGAVNGVDFAYGGCLNGIHMNLPGVWLHARWHIPGKQVEAMVRRSDGHEQTDLCKIDVSVQETVYAHRKVLS